MLTSSIEQEMEGGEKEMRKFLEVLFVISVLFCGISFILMTPFGIPVLIGLGEKFGDEVMFKIWGIWFAPWVLAGIMFWCIGSKNAIEALDKFDRLMPRGD